jgi:formylmethanofuran:tetrahydromethanopterin formyltransferase
MRTGIESIWDLPEVSCISAGNYDGKLGRYRVRLKELFG